MKNLTMTDILTMRPCSGYEKDRLTELGAGRTSITPLEILDLDIPIIDRFWVVLRNKVIGAKICDEIGCVFAEHVLPIFEKEYPDDRRPRKAIEVTRRHIAGDATDDERSAARGAAWAAAWAAGNAAWAAGDAARGAGDAARGAAWDAARGAAWGAARGAARGAAWAAAGAAGWDAADAADAAEQKWQLEQTRAILDREGE